MNESIRSAVEFSVRGYDCGYGGPLRTFALVNFLQEAAGANATALGFGMGELQAKGRTWMLSRLDLRVDELPCDGDRLLVRTWPAGSKKLFAMRAIEMVRPDLSLPSGERILARAAYAYLIVDIALRRPLRPESVFGDGMPGAGEALPVSDYSFDIPAMAEPAPAFVQRVCARHIDDNGHANNAHIINWLVDAASSSRGSQGARLAALRVEFAAEALLGDELVASWGSSGPGTVAELARGDAKVARALVNWRSC
jgi:medium-chain acyl-[acyl-carrier-protein] hydrolase